MDTKLDKVMAHGIGPPRKNSQDFFDHLIICILITYISNSAILQCYSSIWYDTKLDRVLAYDMRPPP